MSQVTIERRRNGADVAIGILFFFAGLYVLGNVVLATAITALFIGWFALLSGLVELIGAFFKIRSGQFWSNALGGAVLAVLGLFVLRNPGIAVRSRNGTRGNQALLPEGPASADHGPARQARSRRPRNRDRRRRSNRQGFLNWPSRR